MKAVILAGGFGTRLSEETELKPKPMVEIGDKPILWHIMKIYSAYGINEFVILLGYKGYMIKEYFANYFLHQSDVTINLANNKMEIHNTGSEPWIVTLLDTGLNTLTGGRIKRAQHHLDSTFLLTYGDGVADVNIKALLDYHYVNKAEITMTAVQPAGRFGAINVVDGKVGDFVEKPKGDGTWINGGFFVCEPSIFDYIEDDTTVFEQQPLTNLAKDQKLWAYEHTGFWRCMDTLRDRNELVDMWESGEAQWKMWD